MKKLVYFLVVIIGIVWLVGASKDTIAKKAAVKMVSATTGLRLDLDSFKLGIIKTDMEIKNLLLYNPPGYKDPVMINIPYVYMDYDFADLIKKDIHIEEMNLELKELLVVRNKDGSLNLNALKPVKEEKQTAKQESDRQVPPVKIDNLALKIGKVIYKDYSQDPANPSIKEFSLIINEKFSNIDDLNALIKIIVAKSLFNTNISNLVGLDVTGLQKSFSNVMPKAQESAESAGAALKDKAEELKKSIFGDKSQ